MRIWESRDDSCSERRTPAVLSSAQHLAHVGTWRLCQEVEEQPGQLSSAQRGDGDLDRAPAPRTHAPLAVPGARAHDARLHVRPDVAPSMGDMQTRKLVLPQGASIDGRNALPLHMVDASTGGSERVAVPGTGPQAMEGGVRRILNRWPFATRSASRS